MPDYIKDLVEAFTGIVKDTVDTINNVYKEIENEVGHELDEDTKKLLLCLCICLIGIEDKEK